jgi:hypothetical protein
MLEATAEAQHDLSRDLASEYGHQRHIEDFEDCQEPTCVGAWKVIKEACPEPRPVEASGEERGGA